MGRAGGVKFRASRGAGKGVRAAVERVGRATAEPREASAWKVSQFGVECGGGRSEWRGGSMEAGKMTELGGW